MNQGKIPNVGMLKITQANASLIDTLNLSPATKTLFYNAVAKGNTIYTPTAPVTYANWQGTFYIALDPVTGFGAYVIGEGLNGGYFQQFLDSLRGLLIPTAEASLGSHVTAVISAPANAITYGAKFIVDIAYKVFNAVGNLISQWTEKREVDTRDIGAGTTQIEAGYGADGMKDTQISRVKLGKAPNDLDAQIIATAQEVSDSNFTMPPDLFKAVLQQESGLKYKSYRYEPCYDRRRISGMNRPLENKNVLNEQPYKHYRTATNNPDLDPQLLEGDQVDGITVNGEKVTIKDFYTTYSVAPLAIGDADGNGKITAYDIWKLNDAKQHYSEKRGGDCVMTPEDGNFTPQFLISASYGLGQVMYPTAVGSIPRNGTGPAENIGKLIEPNLTKSAQKLKTFYQDATTEGASGLCAIGGKWWNALLKYNGGSNPDYPVDICKWYNQRLYRVMPE